MADLFEKLNKLNPERLARVERLVDKLVADTEKEGQLTPRQLRRLELPNIKEMSYKDRILQANEWSEEELLKRGINY